MRYLAVIDTNVLVSSLLTKKKDSPTVKVTYAIADGSIIPLYSQEILEEYADVLHRKKFSFSKLRIEKLLSLIREYGIFVQPHKLSLTLPDMDDLKFYEIFIEKQDENTYLVTGNIRHFPHSKNIVTPDGMMRLLENI